MSNNANQRFLFTAEEKKAERKLKELLQTLDEIMEAFKGLIFARDDVQPLIDGSTNEMVSFANENMQTFFFSSYLCTTYNCNSYDSTSSELCAIDTIRMVY